jgi:hypothetical protein
MVDAIPQAVMDWRPGFLAVAKKNTGKRQGSPPADSRNKQQT